MRRRDDHSGDLFGPGEEEPARRNTGKELRDRGTDETLDAEHEYWKALALSELAVFSRERQHFVAEEFRAHFVAKHFAPHSHKVWGALFLAAARMGMIESTGQYRHALSPGTHAHPVKIWMRPEQEGQL